MNQVVGIYTQRSSADAARDLLTEAGYFAERVTLLAPRLVGSISPPMKLRQRGESMRRMAVRWGIIGALITEVPLLVALFVLAIDVNIKVLLVSTVWKFGGAFGAWMGAMAASDRGLEDDVAIRYEGLLNDGKWVLSADVRSKHRPYARGAMLESNAEEVRDVYGTFEVKLSPAMAYQSLDA